jgi:hypothetical protein
MPSKNTRKPYKPHIEQRWERIRWELASNKQASSKTVKISDSRARLDQIIALNLGTEVLIIV